MSDIFDYIYKLKKLNEPFVIVTVVTKEGEGPQIAGSKMVVIQNGETSGTVGGGALEKAAINKSFEVFKSKKSVLCYFNLGGDTENNNFIYTDMKCGGTIGLFFDYIASCPHVYIFGAGHVGKSAAYHLKDLQYKITLIDHREGIFEGADNNNIDTITGSYANVISQLNITPNSYFIIATFGHRYDYEVLENLYKKSVNPAYIALLSSKSKAEDILSRFINTYGRVPMLDKLYAPAGLDIGGSTPDDIAISIISEMQSVRHNRAGHKHLRVFET